MELEASWRSFVTARMVMMSLAIEKLQAENKILWEEIRNMQQKNRGWRGAKGYKDDGGMDEEDCGVDVGKGVGGEVRGEVRDGVRGDRGQEGKCRDGDGEG